MQHLKHGEEVIKVDRITHPRWVAPEVRRHTPWSLLVNRCACRGLCRHAVQKTSTYTRTCLVLLLHVLTHPSCSPQLVCAVLWFLQVLETASLSTASDVYSFGVVMYELLTFKVPFEDLAIHQVGVSPQTKASGNSGWVPARTSATRLLPTSLERATVWLCWPLWAEWSATPAASHPTCLAFTQVVLKVLRAARPEVPSFDKLPPNTSRICESLMGLES